MKIKMNSKKALLMAATAVLIIALLIANTIGASADMVDVYTNANPTLTMENIWSEDCIGYKSDGVILSQNDGIYKIKSNGYNMWYQADGLDYAYIASKFNTGKGTVMTIKTTVTKFDGKEIGIVARQSLSSDSPEVMVSLRTDGSYAIFRTDKHVDCDHRLLTQEMPFGTQPIHLKLELDKTKARAVGSFKIGGDINSEDGWSSVFSITLSFLKTSTSLYTGIVSTTGIQNKYADVEFQGFSINLKAPEGYVEEAESGGGETPSEPEIVLPKDMEAPGDAMLYETFTDGNLFPEDEKISIANPKWTLRKGAPVFEVDAAQTNRYVSFYPADDTLMMTAGDMSWTDYSTQFDVTFPPDTLLADQNSVALLIRHRSAILGGSSDYFVRLINKISDGNFTGQYLQLCYRPGENTFIPKNPVILKEVMLSQTGMIALGKAHTIRVDAVDNVFNVYLDGECKISYTDDNSLHKKSDPNLFGCVGLCVQKGTIQVDNLLVRKLNDPLGGNYDNEIMGNYDQPIPDWLQDRYGKK